MQAAYSSDLLPVIWIDVTDLIDYLRDNRTVSGIQRVVSQLLRHAHSAGEADIRPAYLDRHDPCLVHAVALGPLLEALSAIETGSAPQGFIDRKLKEALAGAAAAPLKPGDIYFIPGAFWNYAAMDFLRVLQAQGLRIVPLIHDLIQIDYPEFVPAGAGRKFLPALVDLLSASAGVLAISEYVADTVRDFLGARLGRALPVRAIGLATETPGRQGAPVARSSATAHILHKPYVLCVGTLDIRKNNLYLVRIWEALRRDPQIAPPQLVFVGKPGWGSKEFLTYVAKQGYLGDWLFVLDNVVDDELAQLYENCLFTAYVSFVEGWGLPIGESLARGKPCLASGVTAMPEVGGALVKYVDPADWQDGLRAVRALLADPAGLADWQDQVRQNFVPKSWAQFAAESFAAVRAIAQSGQEPLPCRLLAGNPYRAGDDFLRSAFRFGQKLDSFRTACRSGWRPPEDWGVWAALPKAELGFVTTLPAGSRAQLYLEIVPPPGLRWGHLRIGPETGRAVFPVGRTPRLVTCDLAVGAGGSLTVALQALGTFPSDAFGTRYFGISALAYCAADDVAARQSLFEVMSTQLGSAPPAPGDEASRVMQESALFSRLLQPGKTGSGLFRRGWLSGPINFCRLELARAAARRKDWGRAERHYAAIIRSGHATGADWIQLGHALTRQGSWEAAAGAYHIAQQRLPENREIGRHLREALAGLSAACDSDGDAVSSASAPDNLPPMPTSRAAAAAGAASAASCAPPQAAGSPAE